MDKPELTNASFRFIQEGNTDGTTEDTEVLQIDFENIMLEPPGYIVLRTQGWSIDHSDELYDLLLLLSNKILEVTR